MAAAAGVHSEETFTGFKWIGKIATERPDLRLVLGYEQALGYLVAQRPLDKDGITAAVLMAEIAAVAVADGVTLQDRLDAIADRFGQYVTAELSVKMPPAQGAAWVAAIEADPPAEVGGRAVTSVTTYPEAGLVRLMLDGGVRLQIRPSGTEPKVKLYAEAVDLDPEVLQSLLAALTPDVTIGVRHQIVTRSAASVGADLGHERSEGRGHVPSLPRTAQRRASLSSGSCRNRRAICRDREAEGDMVSQLSRGGRCVSLGLRRRERGGPRVVDEGIDDSPAVGTLANGHLSRRTSRSGGSSVRSKSRLIVSVGARAAQVV